MSRMKIRKRWFYATALVANQCFADLWIWYKKIFLSKIQVFSSSIAMANARQFPGQIPGGRKCPGVYNAIFKQLWYVLVCAPNSRSYVWISLYLPHFLKYLQFNYLVSCFVLWTGLIFETLFFTLYIFLNIPNYTLFINGSLYIIWWVNVITHIWAAWHIANLCCILLST